MGPPTFRIIGPGRAGGSLELALEAAGWKAAAPVRHGEDPADAARAVDFLFITVPDASIQPVAAVVRPQATTTVIHLSGALGPDQLLPHAKRAAVHPLASLPNAELGSRRLRSGIWFGVTADRDGRDGADQLIDSLGGHALTIPADRRTLYHATACVASNHVVTLLAQVERLAAAAGAPLEAFLDLAQGSLENVRQLGPGAALTGPAARGDWETVNAHRRALPPDEIPLYEVLAAAAARLTGGVLPPL